MAMYQEVRYRKTGLMFLVRTLIIILCLVSVSQAQLQNYLTALTQNDSGQTLLGNPSGNTNPKTVFFSLATATDSIMSSLQKYGKQAGNYASLSAAVTDAAGDTASLIVSERHAITTSTTLSGTQTAIIALQGAKFNISSGVLLTINAPFYAGPYQVFEGNIDSIRFSVGSIIEAYPEWFGATGDSTTNDRAAIQAALDALPTGGGIVRLLPGNYDLATDSLVVPDGAMIIGSGSMVRSSSQTPGNSGVTRIIYSGTSYGINFGDGSNYTTRGATLKNLVIDGESTGSSAIRLHGDTGSSSWGNLIENVKIQRFTSKGIDIVQRAWSNTIRHVAIVPEGSGTAIDIQQEGNDTLLDDIDIDDDGASVPSFGVRVGKGSGSTQHNIRLTNSVIQGCSLAVLYQAPTTMFNLLNTYFEGDSIAVHMKTASPIRIAGCNFVGVAGKPAPVISDGSVRLEMDLCHFLGSADSSDIWVASSNLEAKIGVLRLGSSTVTPGLDFATGVESSTKFLDYFGGATQDFAKSYTKDKILQLKDANSEYFILDATDTLVTFDGVGRVGIGTSTPDDIFHIDDGTNNMRFTGNQIKFSKSTGISTIDYGTSGSSGGSLQLRANSTNDIVMTFADDGNIGIGTATPVGVLSVEKSSSTDTLLFFSNNTVSSAFDSSMIMLPNGNVGIGMHSPASKLTVVSNDTMAYDGFQTAAFAAGRDAFWFDPGGDTLFVKNNGTVRFVLTTAYSGGGH